MPMLVAPWVVDSATDTGSRPCDDDRAGAPGRWPGWVAATVTPAVDYALLVPGLILAGGGQRPVLRTPSAAVFSAVSPHEHGQASGAAAAIRELAVVIGVTALGLVFASTGGDDSRRPLCERFRSGDVVGCGGCDPRPACRRAALPRHRCRGPPAGPGAPANPVGAGIWCSPKH